MKVASFAMIEPMIYILLIVWGLCFGSFVNAWVWRLRQQELLEESKPKRGKHAAKDLSIVHGRSMCVDCHHTLAWYDLLPVVSWLSLGGKCRYCHKPISWQYPLVELVTAVLFVVSYAAWPDSLQSPVSSLQFFLWLVFVVSFMALLVYDVRWMLLPNKIVFPLMGVAAVFLVCEMVLSGEPWMALWGAIGGLLAVGGLFWVLYQVSDGKWIGGGDVKLGFVLGILAGSPVQGLLVIFVASVLGTLAALPQLVSKRLKASSRIPFGPFLIVATVVVVLWGQRMVDWYLGIIL
jgi:prepilin signal peptidase PulO-like enzyme (type II secretory pathway)